MLACYLVIVPKQPRDKALLGSCGTKAGVGDSSAGFANASKVESDFIFTADSGKFKEF
jgi:hypothetical protein